MSKSVLLVEDNANIRLALKTYLTMNSYVVLEAAGVQEALALARESKIDVVLCDLSLPDGNGEDVRKALPASIPVIAVTGHVSGQVREDAERAGFISILNKPAPLDQLLASLHDALSKNA
jgi:DNA-binding NtrC family response regulator